MFTNEYNNIVISVKVGFIYGGGGVHVMLVNFFISTTIMYKNQKHFTRIFIGIQVERLNNQ